MDNIINNLGLIITLGVIVIVVVSILPFIPLIRKSKSLLNSVKQTVDNNSSVLLNGKAATAKVLGISQVGKTMVNFQPLVRIQLEINDNDMKYEVTIETLIPQIHIPQVQPGATIAVKIDPNDRNKVALQLG